jgi:hypothetical protein
MRLTSLLPKQATRYFKPMATFMDIADPLELHQHWGLLGMARCNRGLILEELGQLDAALAAYDSANILARRAGEQGLMATVASNRRMLLTRLGRIDI